MLDAWGIKNWRDDAHESLLVDLVLQRSTAELKMEVMQCGYSRQLVVALCSTQCHTKWNPMIMQKNTQFS
jgi:hypothetical protein